MTPVRRTRAHRGPRAALAGAAVLTVVGCESAPLTSLPPDFAAPTSSTTLRLEPGAFTTLTGAQAVAPIDIAPAEETQTFVVAIQNTSDRAGGGTPYRLNVRREAQISASASRSARRAVAPKPLHPRLDAWAGRGELDFRADVRRQIDGARATSGRARPAPVVGQIVEFRSPVTAEGELDTCASTERVTGIVRAVTPSFAIVEDMALVDSAGASPLSAADYASFLSEAEEYTVPVSEAYFGSPPDVDRNGVVYALVTLEVNRLGAAGFFTASDLAAVEDCAASNEGEVLWLIAPDPVGRHGSIISIDLVKDRLVGVLTHELQHLIHAGRRTFEGGGALGAADEPWLNEGLSHIAEEVTGLYVAGLRTGQNLSLSDLDDPVVNERFRRYHLGDMSIVANYLESTTNVPLLPLGPTTRNDFSRARGFGYLFLRWLADRFATGGGQGLVGTGDEEALFRALTLGGPGLLQSTANVEAALLSTLGARRTWDQLLGEYAAVPAVDDFTEPQVPLAPALQLSTWDLQGAYENARLNGFAAVFPNGFPLDPPLLNLGELPAGGFADSFELYPSSVYYIRLEASRETPLTRLSIGDATGDPITSNADLQITIVRTF
ncbi:MAG: hypothetical protein MJB57_12445 [Gemmatimonadetes bacterium]|nr:hypothetical protein [Gemmatimonadota bacterium]